MTTPNQMPKKPNPIKLQIVDALLSMSPSSWERKSISRDDNGKEVVATSRVVRSVLRYPLAQNVSDQSVESVAARFL